jgi:hypothetical protein
MDHLSAAALDAGLDQIRAAPRDVGRVELVVRRPATDEREVLAEGTLDRHEGLVGDTWQARGSSRTPDGGPHPDMQLNIINARVSTLIARHPSRRALAGDQLHLDLDLSEENLPPGTRLEVGTALIEITDQPHRGCAKFAERYGRDALRFVNFEVGRQLRLRGANAKVVRPGVVRPGDVVRKALADHDAPPAPLAAAVD